MRLNKVPFEAIRSGIQQIETRLYDEKRRTIKPGDTIIFSLLPDENKRVRTEVVGLSIFQTFQQLFEAIDKRKFGYEEHDDLDYQISCMRKYYPEEEEQKYGVVGIHVKVIA